MIDHAPQSEAAPRRRGMGFTLIELLVVMAVIAIIGSIVIVAFAGFAREARLSSGTNTVLAALGNARAEALKNNRLVLVALVPRILEGREQVVEIVTAEWTGDTFVYPNMVDPGPGGSSITEIVDRFAPIPDLPVRQLPRGIKVAGPLYADSANIVVVNGVNTGDRDSFWATQAHLPALVDGNGARLTNPPPEAPGRILAVMFSPDGSVVDSNPESDASLVFIDFQNANPRNPTQDFDGQSYYGRRFDSGTGTWSENVPMGLSRIALAEHFLPGDEPVVTFVPFLSLYDDAAARKLYVGDDPANDPWTDVGRRDDDLRAFLTENATRIHFNSYTGVAMR